MGAQVGAWARPAGGGYRRHLLRHLVALLHWPLTYTDFASHAEEREPAAPAPGEPFAVVARCFALCADLARYDVHRFVQLALRRREVAGLAPASTDGGDAEEEEAPEEEDPAPDEDQRYAARGLLVLLYCAHFPRPLLGPGRPPVLPQVLAPLYGLHFCLPFVLGALAPAAAMQAHEGPATRAALALLRQLLARLPDASLPAAALDEEASGRVLGRLMALVAFHECRLVRRLALRCLTRWFWAMRARAGKWRLFLLVWRRSGHAGLRGHFVKLVKDHVHLALAAADPGCDGGDDFLGPGMETVLRTMAALPHGATTDLLEHQDVLLPVLNFFIYLALSDAQNRTRVWNLLPWLEENLFAPIRTGLNMSRAHYQHRVDTVDVEEEMRVGKATGATTEVQVGGVSLPQLTKEEKLEVYQSALLRFDLMESVLGQLTSVLAARKPFPCPPPAAAAASNASLSSVA